MTLDAGHTLADGLVIRGLHKRYGDTVALDGLDLHARPGEILGVAGPNGAGKSTVIKVLAAETTADSGVITVGGVPWSPSLAVHRVAVVHQEPQLFPNLTVEENLVVGRERRRVLRHGANEQERALDDMRRNIDAWWPHVDEVDAIVMTASGCGVTVKEYGHLLAHDELYAAKAERISALTQDLSEIMPAFEQELAGKLQGRIRERVAYHPPCTLQHGQKVRGKVESLLRAAGVDVVLCADSHSCCGSAGTYSVTQPELSYQLRDNKLANLAATGAKTVVSANIGCITHLQSGTATPVRHWIELLDDALRP